MPMKIFNKYISKFLLSQCYCPGLFAVNGDLKPAAAIGLNFAAIQVIFLEIAFHKFFYRGKLSA
jgi:hypothetical protein